MFKVLLIDDEKMVLISTEHSFPFANYGMFPAEKTCDPYEALRLLQETRFDAALVDIRMPGMSGMELISLCREKGVETEFVVVSGHSDFSFMKQAIQLSAFDYCLKPVQREESERLTRRLSEKLYENRFQRDGAALLELQKNADLSEGLRPYGLNGLENALTVLLVNAPDIRPLFEMGEYIGKRTDFLLSEEQEVILLSIPPSEEERAVSLFLSVPGCRMAAASTSLQAGPGQLQRLLEQMKADILLTNERSPLIRTVCGETSDAFARILEHVRTHYTEELSLHQLADGYNVSYSYLSELFKTVTGYNFSKYLTNLRLKTAAEQIKTTNNSIADISFAVGYRNYHHFIGMFKAFYGVTPSEYRKRQGDEPSL